MDFPALGYVLSVSGDGGRKNACNNKSKRWGRWDQRQENEGGSNEVSLCLAEG